MNQHRSALLVASFMFLLGAQPSPAYDMSGRWLVTVAGGVPDLQWDVVETDAAISVAVWSKYGGGTEDGTFDSVTGVFAFDDFSLTPYCGPDRLDGTVDAGSTTLAGTWSVSDAVWVPGIEPRGGHFECRTFGLSVVGSRCGNEQLEAGEACDDANRNDGDCCSATCEIATDGSACNEPHGCGTGNCSSGACVVSAPAPAGRACDSAADICTDNDCDGAGSCVAVTPANSGNRCQPDFNPCTDDLCDASGNCSNTFNSAPCMDDGNPCTTDVCDGAGGCSHVFNTVPCADDGNPCTTDVCDGAGGCSHPFSTAPCADDGNSCTDDLCDGAGSCGHVPNTDYCASDGNQCTTDVCDGAGNCSHVGDVVDACYNSCGQGHCASGTCIMDLFNPVGSSCGALSPCWHKGCDGAGNCTMDVFPPAGTECDDDSSVCTQEACDGAGSCQLGEPLDCSPCGTCDADAGCVSIPVDPEECDTGALRVTASVAPDPDDGETAKLAVVFKQPIAVENFGDPTLDTDYTLCLDATDSYGVSRPLAWMTVPAGASCREESCWQPFSRGFIYKDSTLGNGGLASIRLDEAKGIKIGGKGPNLPFAGVSWRRDANLRAKLIASDGVTTQCWYRSVPPLTGTSGKLRWSWTAPKP